MLEADTTSGASQKIMTTEALATASNQEQEYLTFLLNDEEYGVDILAVQEIRAWSETRNLPNSPEFMCGVIDIRGGIVPIIDLRKRFGMGLTKPSEKNVFIIIIINHKMIGILVDAVSDILKVKSDDIKEAPDVERNLDQMMIKGLISSDNHMAVILNTDNLLAEESLEQINNVVQES